MSDAHLWVVLIGIWAFIVFFWIGLFCVGWVLRRHDSAVAREFVIEERP